MKIIRTLSFFAFVSLFLYIAGPVFAQATDTVSATVTVQNVSVSVTDGIVDFQTIASSGTKDTTTGGEGVDDSQTATNDGNVSVDLDIKAVDTANWTLGATAGVETYTMKYCTSDCDSSPTWTSVGIHPSYATLATGVAASGSQVFDLQVGVPTSTSNYTEQTITVTVMASIAS